MAKYSDIKGFTVQTLSTDTLASAVAGGSWASGGSLNTARRSGGGAGTQTAGLAFGGNIPPAVANTETYNGTSFTEVADLNTARQDIAGCGTQTAALSVGGGPGSLAITELWNGSGWTEVADLNQGRENVKSQSAGTSTASIMWGGYNDPAGNGYALNESWNGSSWTEVGDLNTGRYNSAGNGIQTAAVVAGGTDGSSTLSQIESWNGSAWTEVAEANTARGEASGSGTYQDFLLFGGTPPVTGKTEIWNGTSWTEVNDMATSRFASTEARGGTSSATYAAGGRTPSVVATTEEFTAPSVFTKQIEGQLYFNSTTNTFKETVSDIPAGTWASGGNLNTAREILAGWGTDNTAAGVAGGNDGSSAVNNSELYNGSAWTEVNNLNQARSAVAGVGLYSAAMAAGASPNTYYDKVELWDGTNWTETTEMNTSRGYSNLSGVQTACILIGGYSNPPLNRYAICEQWDGSSWTEIADLNTGRPGVGSAAGAPVSDTIAFGGYAPGSPTKQDLVEKWDGSSWTEVAEMNSKRNVPTGHGDSGSNAGAFGGEQDSSTTNAELWNGSSWTEVANNTNAGWRQLGGVASLTKGILAGGGSPAYAHTEEWNAALANKTITAS
jgi:hypothetical protein